MHSDLLEAFHFHQWSVFLLCYKGYTSDWPQGPTNVAHKAKGVYGDDTGPQFALVEFGIGGLINGRCDGANYR